MFNYFLCKFIRIQYKWLIEVKAQNKLTLWLKPVSRKWFIAIVQTPGSQATDPSNTDYKCMCVNI